MANRILLMRSCIQCGEQADYKFCPNCGQKQNIPRLTLRTFFNDFFSRIYGLDGAFPRTLTGLAKNPAIVAKEYIKGIRGKYVGPVGYYFLMFAIFLLLVQISDYTLEDYLPKTEEYTNSMVESGDTEQGQRAEAIGLLVKQKVFSNIQYVSVLMVPLVAFWCGIWFRKSNFNFLENTVFSFFIHAQAIAINILGFIFFVFSGLKSNILVTILSVLYYMWSVSLFYDGKVGITSLLKGFAAYLLSYASFIIFVSLVVLLLIITAGVSI